jgi:protein-tyrosine phosphatase
MHTCTDKPQSRSLLLEGASNFRDVGGYATRDGRRVRWRRIFRSNHLGQLSGADLATIGAIGLRSIVDFRCADEVAKAPPVPIPGAVRHATPIDPSMASRLQDKAGSAAAATGAQTESLMHELYRDFVRHHAQAFRVLFGHLLADATPLVFHCSAGKDRTGLAAALVLCALGVPRAQVVDDYLLTNLHWRMDRAGMDLPGAVLDVIERADHRFLGSAFDTIDAEFGGMDRYLREHAGLPDPARAQLTALYLES